MRGCTKRENLEKNTGKKWRVVPWCAVILCMLVCISGCAGEQQTVGEQETESIESVEKIAVGAVNTEYNWYTHKGGTYTISEEELELDEVAVLMDFEEAAIKGITNKYYGAHTWAGGDWMEGEGGCLPGTGDGDWYCVVVDGVEYIYAKYDHLETYDYMAYAIVDEKWVLGNGLHVGMSREDVLECCPGIADTKLQEEAGKDYVWNKMNYPACWDDGYDYAMLVNVEDEVEDNPRVYLALMMKENRICAMTPYLPNTDGYVYPEQKMNENLQIGKGWKDVTEYYPIKDKGISVYESAYEDGNSSYLMALLTNGEDYVLFETEDNRFEVLPLGEEHLLFCDCTGWGSGVLTWDTYVLQTSDMAIVDDLLESPFVFLDKNMTQVTDGRYISMTLMGERYIIPVWKYEGGVSDKLDYDMWASYYIEERQLICDVGLGLHNANYAGIVKLVYVYEDGRYVVNEEQVTYTPDETTYALALETLQEEFVVKAEGMDIDGNGVAEDTLYICREREEETGYNVLTVELDNGLSSSIYLPSNNGYVNDEGAVWMIPDLQRKGQNSIVVILTDPTSNYFSSDYYVLHAEQNEATQVMELKVDLAVWDGGKDAEGYEEFQNVSLEMPFSTVTYYGRNPLYYHEKLKKDVLCISGLTDGEQKGTRAYLYWENDSWSISKEPVSVVLYEETYMDERSRAWAVREPEYTEDYIYDVVYITNVTEESFDFSVIRRDFEKDEQEIIISTHTAFFEADGVHASCKTEEFSLIFDFSENLYSFPVVLSFTISGYEELEGIRFFCDNIPGFEAG